MFKIKLADRRERLGRERREKQKGRTVQHHDDTGPGIREVAQIEQRRERIGYEITVRTAWLARAVSIRYVGPLCFFFLFFRLAFV
jgi:hypothetical protein